LNALRRRWHRWLCIRCVVVAGRHRSHILTTVVD
jgi:hypothetical protein